MEAIDRRRRDEDQPLLYLLSSNVTRLERNANIAAVVIPFLGVIVAAVLLWNHFLGPRDLAIFAVMYLLSGVGITVGFHRLLTHRAFETAPLAALHARDPRVACRCRGR